ncbi:MAG: hypothetical protein GTN64_05655 [Candidatus Latescibacteria bacterium]|nr:hypothetical protein [Candidatus Latescibacterota bacterium]NIO78095.1 hypothetical protein [Candidatus Latescibacterota bacterium]
MCVYSMILDHYRDKWNPLVPQPITAPPTSPPIPASEPPITDGEIREFRRLLERAREYDRGHNQPDCETEEKKAEIKALAQKLGIEIDFIDLRPEK